MAISDPVSDTSRVSHLDPDQSWPHAVKIQLVWKDEQDRNCVRTEYISAAQFFGRGSYGAPLDGAHLINMIERMRREDPPEFARKKR